MSSRLQFSYQSVSSPLDNLSIQMTTPLSAGHPLLSEAFSPLLLQLPPSSRSLYTRSVLMERCDTYYCHCGWQCYTSRNFIGSNLLTVTMCDSHQIFAMLLGGSDTQHGKLFPLSCVCVSIYLNQWNCDWCHIRRQGQSCVISSVPGIHQEEGISTLSFDMLH